MVKSSLHIFDNGHTRTTLDVENITDSVKTIKGFIVDSKPLKKDHINDIKALASRGVPLKAIAVVLGISYSYVTKLLRKDK